VTTTYTVSSTNAFGCTNTASVTVTVDSAVTAGITITRDTICKGDSTTLTASGGGTYHWNTGATTQSITVSPNSTATYSVTVTKAICSATATMKVVVNPVPNPLVTQSGDTLKCTPTGMTYQWYRNGTPRAGSTFDTAIVSAGGTYKVLVTNSSGCSDTAVYTVTSLQGVNEVSFTDFINVYPNPTNGDLHIECTIPDGNYTLSLTDVLGQILYTDKLHINGKYAGNINMYSYAPGMYILTIKGSNSTTQKKILLSK
jgi:hypothetical protein